MRSGDLAGWRPGRFTSASRLLSTTPSICCSTMFQKKRLLFHPHLAFRTESSTLSPTTWTSVCNSIPRPAFAVCLIISINRRTSQAVACPSFTMKFPCTSETTAPPTRVPLRPSSSMSLPAGIAGGFLKMHPALGAAGWEAQRFWLKRSFAARSHPAAQILLSKQPLEQYGF